MSKLLGMAVGAALENREALQNVGVPAKNVAGGVGKVIWGTMWKSTVLGFGIILVWAAAFICTYMLGRGNSVMGQPMVTVLLGLFLFLVMPVLVAVRETRRVGKAVTAKNDAHWKFVEFERNAQAEQDRQAIANLNAQQAQQGAFVQ